MSENDAEYVPDPIEETKRLSREYQASNQPSGMAWTGTGGFHTLFRHDDGLDYALTTALHGALEFGLDELYLDASHIERRHGEVTPQTARQELEDVLAEFYDLSPHSWFVTVLCDAFEEQLESIEKGLRMEADRDE